MNKFFEPLRGEMRKDTILPMIIGGLGIFPATYLGHREDSFWICAGVFLIWYLMVYIIYLTFLFLKNK